LCIQQRTGHAVHGIGCRPARELMREISDLLWAVGHSFLFFSAAVGYDFSE